jgi:hypothetical protein
MAILKAIRITLNIGFRMLIVAFLILFALQIEHPPHLDDFWLFIQLHKYGDPLITVVGLLFGLPWPTRSMSVQPVAACIVAWGIKILVDDMLDRVQWALSKPRPRPRLIGLTRAARADPEKARPALLKR